MCTGWYWVRMEIKRFLALWATEVWKMAGLWKHITCLPEVKGISVDSPETLISVLLSYYCCYFPCLFITQQSLSLLVCFLQVSGTGLSSTSIILSVVFYQWMEGLDISLESIETPRSSGDQHHSETWESPFLPHPYTHCPIKLYHRILPCQHQGISVQQERPSTCFDRGQSWSCC